MTEGEGTTEERPRLKEYEGEGITVTFEPRRCLHAAECVHGLPEVFDLSRRPWVLPGAAEPARVAEVVRRCPSGALQYHHRPEDAVPEPRTPPPRSGARPPGSWWCGATSSWPARTGTGTRRG
ncbi:(4Fe-4S)-binding protein [Streptomyces sp. PanSC19]|uniref:(4Fe-4S)-binding protein n=1 Tax=Streptomyces sp. PanSC19 TaxID=1520455 RepID=UPI0026AF4ED3